MRPISSSTSSSVPSLSHSKIASAFRSYPAWTKASTAAIMGLSIISKPAGMMPAAITAATASPALRMSSKLAMMQRAIWGLGTSLTVTSIVTASIPSLPITRLSRS